MLEDNNFIHLHSHSVYSFYDALSKIDELLSKTVQNGLKALALTDHGTLSGISEFNVKAKSHKVKPIFGCEIYVETKTGVLYNNKPKKSHLVLLAKNRKGYKNLIKIHNFAWRNFYYKPTASYEFIEENKEGLLCLTGCIAGDLNKFVEKSEEEANSYLNYLYNIFKDDLYLEAQPLDMYEKLNNFIFNSDYKYVITNDIHYIEKEDYFSHNILTLIRDKKTVTDLEKGNAFIYKEGLHFRTPDELKECCNKEQWQNCLKSCKEIYEKIEEIRLFTKPHIPSISDNAEEEIKELLFEEFNKIPVDKKKEYFARIKREMKVYKTTNSFDYLLIVRDFLEYAKKNGYLCNFGRGSACSSLVTYLLKIHYIDPIKNNLFFERFLNDSRGVKMKVFS